MWCTEIGFDEGGTLKNHEVHKGEGSSKICVSSGLLGILTTKDILKKLTGFFPSAVTVIESIRDRSVLLRCSLHLYRSTNAIPSVELLSCQKVRLIFSKRVSCRERYALIILGTSYLKLFSIIQMIRPPIPITK